MPPHSRQADRCLRGLHVTGREEAVQLLLGLLLLLLLDPLVILLLLLLLQGVGLVRPVPRRWRGLGGVVSRARRARADAGARPEPGRDERDERHGDQEGDDLPARQVVHHAPLTYMNGSHISRWRDSASQVMNPTSSVARPQPNASSQRASSQPGSTWMIGVWPEATNRNAWCNPSTYPTR